MSTKRKQVTVANGQNTPAFRPTADMTDLTLFTVGTATLQYTISDEAAIAANTATWTNVPAGWLGADGFLRAYGYSVMAFRANAGAAASGYCAVWKA